MRFRPWWFPASIFLFVGFQIGAWAVGCQAHPAPSSPAFRRDQIECLLERQARLDVCVQPGQPHDVQIQCIDSVLLDCHSPPDGGSHD
jgi:hypothetical protein